MEQSYMHTFCRALNKMSCISHIRLRKEHPDASREATSISGNLTWGPSPSQSAVSTHTGDPSAKQNILLSFLLLCCKHFSWDMSLISFAMYGTQLCGLETFTSRKHVSLFSLPASKLAPCNMLIESSFRTPQR